MSLSFSWFTSIGWNILLSFNSPVLEFSMSVFQQFIVWLDNEIKVSYLQITDVAQWYKD